MTVVFGTAGHIDHGKTALLRALTGIDADRLPEERARGMTIDVGYAWLALPDGTELDFVDAPGHDRLVGNMLVGAGEVDAGLLVVAADEGIRPQTVEHVEILDLLDLDAGVVAITKADLLAALGPRAASEHEARLRAELVGLLGPTALSRWPVVTVSAVSGAGLDELLARLVEVRDALPSRLAAGARLAIDRAFSPRGHGVVVTGSLRGGGIVAGETLRLVPGDRRVRVRGLQVHRTERGAAAAGGRVALALAGVELAQVGRGMVLAATPAVVGTRRFDAELHLLPAGHAPLRSGAEVRVHLGTDHVLARIRLLGRRNTLGPGERGFARLDLARAVALAAGDRFVIRRPTPPTTLGGGSVLDPWPASRTRRKAAGPGALEALTAGDAPSRLVAMTELHGALLRTRAVSIAAAERDPATILDAATSGVRVAGGLFVAPRFAASLEDAAVAAVRTGHEANPLARGTPLAELRALTARALRRETGVGVREADDAATALLAALVSSGQLAREGELVRDPSFRRSFPPQVEVSMERLVAALRDPAPPSLAAVAAEFGLPSEAVRALESAGRIVRVDQDLAYEAATYARLRQLALDLARRGPLSPAAYRDATGTSRKYALALLEHLDGLGELRRTALGHILGPRAPRTP